MRWEKLQIQTKHGEEMGPVCGGPGKIWGHTCNAVRGGKLLYVFGGFGKDHCPTNQVHVFDTTKRTWSKPEIKGTLPAPRDSHSCTLVGDNLFVFGGTDGENPLKDLHILDTSSNTWISPNVRGEGPEAREGHSAALIGKQLFIFGGCGRSSNSSDEECYDNLYILNTETLVWKCAVTSGTPPAKCDNHTCSSWKNKIIVIGGEDSHDYSLSEVHILDIDTGLWTKVMAIGEGPSARFSMAGDSLDPQRGGVLVFIGGCNKDLDALDDMYYLYTGLARENERDERRLEKLSLRKQLKLKCQEQHMLAPAYDKALVRVETNADLYQPIPVLCHIQPSRPNFHLNEYHTPLGKRTFQARVTQSFPCGYSIETVIDGKSLHGVIFFNNSSFNKKADDDSIGKKGAMEIGDAMLNGNLNSKSEDDQDVMDRPSYGVHGEKSSLPVPQMQAVAAASNKNNPAASHDSEPDEVSGDIKSSVAPTVNTEDNKRSNAPYSGTEVTKDNASAAAKDCVTLAPNRVAEP